MGRLVSIDLKLPVPYGNCVGVPISCLLTVFRLGAQVGAFSVIVKTNGLFAALIKTHVPMFQAGHLSLHPLLGRGEGGPGEQQECGQHAAV